MIKSLIYRACNKDFPSFLHITKVVLKVQFSKWFIIALLKAEIFLDNTYTLSRQTAEKEKVLNIREGQCTDKPE